MLQLYESYAKLAWLIWKNYQIYHKVFIQSISRIKSTLLTTKNCFAYNNAGSVWKGSHSKGNDNSQSWIIKIINEDLQKKSMAKKEQLNRKNTIKWEATILKYLTSKDALYSCPKSIVKFHKFLKTLSIYSSINKQKTIHNNSIYFHLFPTILS